MHPHYRDALLVNAFTVNHELVVIVARASYINYEAFPVADTRI